MPTAPRPPGPALGPAPELWSPPTMPPPQPPAPAEGGGPQLRKRRRRASGPLGPSATLRPLALLSQSEAFVCRPPVWLPQFSVPVSFLTRPQPGLLLRQQGAGGRAGAFSCPSPRWPRKSLPRLATCLRGGDTGPAHATPLPSLVRSSTPVPSPGVCAVPLTSCPGCSRTGSPLGEGRGEGGACRASGFGLVLGLRWLSPIAVSYQSRLLRAES